MTHSPVNGNLRFRWMAMKLRLRYALSSPERVLQEAGLRPGMTVLDFGCGPGDFALAAARAVGASGRVYALDRHPLAVRYVERRASRRGWGNVSALNAANPSGISRGSVDIALLYNVLHEFGDPFWILAGLHCALKPEGVLSVMDRHLDDSELKSAVEDGGLFQFGKRGSRTCRFQRVDWQRRAS
ncbi:MAG: methyltransferase domain-containing protein [Planctomycetota bacterium]